MPDSALSPEEARNRFVRDVTRHATKFRKAIERTDKTKFPFFDVFPAGCCGDSSILLAFYLKEEGLGKFLYVKGWRDDRSHAWLEGQGLTVDITADQFEDQDQAVIATAFSEWHQSFLIEDPGSDPSLDPMLISTYELFKSNLN